MGVSARTQGSIRQPELSFLAHRASRMVEPAFGVLKQQIDEMLADGRAQPARRTGAEGVYTHGIRLSRV